MPAKEYLYYGYSYEETLKFEIPEQKLLIEKCQSCFTNTESVSYVHCMEYQGHFGK